MVLTRQKDDLTIDFSASAGRLEIFTNSTMVKPENNLFQK